MTDMDDYYMKVGKYASKPEPKEEDSLLSTYSYLATHLTNQRRRDARTKESK